ncbi:hypothetical protein SAMN04488040_1317 [Sulfitobacter marinus]|uniref:Uncharacterized protein n=1 Tax=Sulfitobacter marinus TaxID=394264 RepID=A0A1I6RLD8_9RHOB|nr:hypothetical protein SAMN04488040_1317 [Sulfitobacter marinus]
MKVKTHHCRWDTVPKSKRASNFRLGDSLLGKNCYFLTKIASLSVILSKQDASLD